MEENNNIQNRKMNGGDLISIILLAFGIVFLIVSFVGAFTQHDTDKWFSRLSVGLICLGLSAIIQRLRK